MCKWILGTELSPEDQRQALASFVHRYTRENVPAWARGDRKDGKPYPVQFDSDAEWLANTTFAVTAAGRLDARVRHCRSNPTWPDNPGLRASFRLSISNAD